MSQDVGGEYVKVKEMAKLGKDKSTRHLKMNTNMRRYIRERRER